MGWKKEVSKLIPNLWAGYRERNRIKSKHVRNLNKLNNNQDIFVDFEDLDTYTLGHRTESKHSKTVEKIRKKGEIQSDLSYHIPSSDDRQEVKALTKNTIRWIRIKNILSFIFTIIFTIILVLLFSTASNLVGSYLFML